MTRRSALAAALTWAAILCSLLAIAGPHGVGATGTLDVWALAAVAAIAVAVTLGITATRLPAVAGYLVVHLIGVLVVVAVSEGLRPPWAWQPLGALWPHAGLSLNPASIALLSAALTWELSYAATWMVLRERRAWLALALVVGTLALGSARALRQPDTAVMALTAVGLAVVVATAALERAARMPRQIHSAAGRWSAPLYWTPVCALLLAVAWVAPGVAAPPAASGGLAGWTAPFAALARHLGLASREAGDTSAGLTHFGSAVAVGGVFNPDGSAVFSARVADPTRWPYWRGAVYDVYRQGAWRTVPAHQTLLPAGTPITHLPAASTAVITQSITLLRPLSTLVTAGMPLTASVAVDVTLSDHAPDAGPLALLPLHGAVSGTYTAASLVASTLPISPAPVLDPAVRAIDLALPPLPARVGALARSLAAGSRDPYAQAWAIQRYLRGAGSRYVYDPSPPQAPAGQDPTDYFLFQSRRGFCTHFASAMVVLARLAGIPARLVTGYAATHLTPAGFVVTTADAHAWPELWIAGRGWLTFEPTPQFHTPFQTGGPPVPAATPATAPASIVAVATPTAQPSHTATPSATARPSETATAHASATSAGQRGAPSAPAGAGGAPSTPAGSGSAGPPHVSIPLQAILAAVALLVLGLLVLLLAPGDAPALYRRMCRLAALLHAGPRAGQTPLEWARRVAALAPGDGAAVLEITGLYVRQRYGNYRPVRADLRLARASWRRVQRRWMWRLLTRRGL